ncbi:DinB family protein [Fibrisoma montanum]|uniref:DinB family protein n=1 Tax=Fibrisoma montanum TaxID=2305895 RepID=A0A418MBG2_9BACT|nr:DinB family protein [Fibrisoma montanum]RIV23699.1 DinB family protein [Fibrisoma montanum]
MTQYSSQLLLWQLADDVNTVRQTIDYEFGSLSAAELLLRPDPAQWSIAECLEHLNTYSRYYVPRIALAIRDGEQRQRLATPTFDSSWLGDYFVRMMEPPAEGKTGARYKAAAKHRPASNLNPETVRLECIQQQEHLWDLLQQAQHVDIGRLKIPISLTRWIRLSLGDVLRFVVVHEQRHLLQAQRVLHTFQVS